MTPEELLAVVDQAAREGWTELDLRDREITELPPEIGQLTGLQKLCIGRRVKNLGFDRRRNPLTSLPPEIGQLASLQTLDLEGNQLTVLPPEIGQLSNLTYLELDFNQLTAVPPEVGQLTGLRRLDLYDNLLMAVPPEIGQLTRLTWLDLRINQLTAVPPEIGQLTRLTWLDLRANQLTAIPPEIVGLTYLTMLALGGNRLTAVPPEVFQLTRLTTLVLHSNQLTIIPPEIAQLIHLTVLDLANNRLTAVPPEVFQLTRLTTLNLRQTQITVVPPEIGQLARLTHLYLSDNQLTAVPQQIFRLISLQRLNLSHTQITAVPPEIGQLTFLTSLEIGDARLTTVPPEIFQLNRLTTLYLSGNHLMSVPPEIGQLANLTSLSLSKNQLTTIPLEISQLTNLRSLDLSKNQLAALPREIGQLTSLTRLDLANNQLIMLPPALRHLTKLKRLDLYGNPLPLPPELLGSHLNPANPQTILDAYFQASRPLREAKLLLVGEGDVGKTAIINRLLHNHFSEKRSPTVGVDIHQWEVAIEQLTVDSENPVEVDALESEQIPLRVNVWDFGGQEIYHATHQFFLTHRSLYLLVLDATQDEAANRLYYWLRHIQSFAGEAPILLVVNKTDLHRLALDERSLRLKYPAIRAVLHVSCKSGDGLPALRQAIEEALAALPHINDWIPLAWFAVKEKLVVPGKDFQPYENYVDLCEAEGITHEAAQQTLARFLHDLGAALHFHDDRHLAGTSVLNPEWVTGGIYAILNEPSLQDSGILRLNDLDKILDRRRYPAHKHTFLLGIMGKFELAVSLVDGQRYLIPGLLPKERPTFDWPADAPVALEYRYAILPAAILSRLMVRLHHHTWQPENSQPVRWRNGLGVARDGCRALIVADPEAARLTIALDGSAPHRRHLLAVIRAQLDEIHTSFAKLEAKLFVPIPGHPSDKAIAYEDLLYYESEQDWTPRYPPIKERINVRVLLDGIESPAEREQLDIRREFRKLSHQLSETEQRILAGQESLRHAILARLDAQETHIVGAILEKLDANQLEMVDLLLDAADRQQIARWEAEELTRLTQQAVLHLTRLRQNQPGADQWQSILALLERDTSWEQKLKFSVPLFPFLSFESEVKVDVRNALKEGWQRLVRRIRVSGRS